MNPARETVALVACVKSKGRVETTARELYTSNLFRKSRRYAEAMADRWFILSAKHGLLAPGRATAPYELTLKGMRAAQRRAWARGVAAAIHREVAPGARLVLLAGSTYIDELKPLLGTSYTLVEPMAGLSMGNRLAWLKARAG